jgi:hypothetical protein
MPSVAVRGIPNNPSNPAPLNGGQEVRYATDGAITQLGGGLAILTKGSAGAYTLAAAATPGALLFITSDTAFQHVVTVPAGSLNGATQTTITFAGAKGDSVILLADANLSWRTVAESNIALG